MRPRIFKASASSAGFFNDLDNCKASVSCSRAFSILIYLFSNPNLSKVSNLACLSEGNSEEYSAMDEEPVRRVRKNTTIILNINKMLICVKLKKLLIQENT